MPLKFNRTDKAILVLAITIMCVFSYFLYDDSFLFHSRESRNAKIGFIKQAENDVRLRASDSFTWNAAHKAEVVFERDSVFTGKRSQTQIDLVDGSKIFLNENSLVTLVSKNGSLELNLRYGNIQTEINPTSKLELKAGSQKIILKKESDSSKIEIKKPKYGLTKIKLISGKLSVKQTANSNIEELVKEQPLIIKPTGVVQKTAPGIINLLTADNAVFYQSPLEKTFLLDWHSQGTENNTLTISKDIGFTKIVLTTPNIKSKVLVKDLQPGTYFWKISGQDAAGNTVNTEPRSFSVQFLEKLAFVEPTEGKKFEAEIDGQIATYKETVKLSWTNLYDTVQVQLATSPDFKQPLLLDRELEKAFSLEHQLGNGIYFARIRGKQKNLFTDWSDPRSFEVAAHAKEPVKPGVPVLLSKKLTFSSSASRSPSSINPIAVKWQPSAQATRYVVEMSFKDPKFTKPTKLASKTTTVNYVPKTYGPHYFRVRAYSSDNVPSDYSDVGELQTKFSAPKLNAVTPVVLRSDNPDSVAPPTNLKLNWNPIYLASKYTVEVSDTKDFKQPETFTVDSNSFTYKVAKPGDVHFRVIASDSSQLQKSEPSNIETSSYAYIKRLSKPILVEPKNKMTVFLQKEIEPFIWLNWDSTTDQKDFELEIAFDKKFTKIHAREKLTENKFLIKTKLPLGKVYWRVRQIDADKSRISDWTEPREFQLIHNKNEGVFK
ncbi:MAG: FecR domain-containing protein [Bdellovibrionaceae bacterium]|nr:FecR domain-containing protein [Pseudobdellovibrionaceae bacterium]